MTGKEIFKRVAIFVALCLFIYIIGDHHGCWIKALFGIPCPGCGMTRAFVSIIRLDIKSAFYYHPLWPVVLIAVFYYTYCIINNKTSQNKFWITVAVIFFVTYIIRMIFMFPDMEPMNFFNNALYLRIFNLFRR